MAYCGKSWGWARDDSRRDVGDISIKIALWVVEIEVCHFQNSSSSHLEVMSRTEATREQEGG